MTISTQWNNLMTDTMDFPSSEFSASLLDDNSVTEYIQQRWLLKEGRELTDLIDACFKHLIDTSDSESERLFFRVVVIILPLINVPLVSL